MDKDVLDSFMNSQTMDLWIDQYIMTHNTENPTKFQEWFTEFLGPNMPENPVDGQIELTPMGIYAMWTGECWKHMPKHDKHQPLSYYPVASPEALKSYLVEMQTKIVLENSFRCTDWGKLVGWSSDLECCEVCHKSDYDVSKTDWNIRVVSGIEFRVCYLVMKMCLKENNKPVLYSKSECEGCGETIMECVCMEEECLECGFHVDYCLCDDCTCMNCQ